MADTMAENSQTRLNGLASSLVDNMVSSHDAVYGRGSMTSTVYDTAWVSMVSKATGDQVEWLFPESFQYVLQQQSDSGGWSIASPLIDRILCSLAALLALCRHRESPLQLSGLNSVVGINERIVKATHFLRTELEDWNVESTDRVGFEILVPSHLEQLTRFGISFKFRDLDILLRIRKQKLSRFDVKILYGTWMCTALHSLEAFDGSEELDFNRVAHHKVCGGSMMASPSSTAAYLMNCSEWDDEAESYIRHAIENGQGKGNGSVPSAFPSTIFELTWVLTNLLDSGFEKAELGISQMEVVKCILQKGFEMGSGCLGFAPGLEPDADDTAVGINVLASLGQLVPVEPLIKKYESDLCFKTYVTERNSSFSANCNVLVALLNAERPNIYLSQVEKIVIFLCKEWWRCTGEIDDKWNVSIYYPTMLLTKALIRVMTSWSEGKLPGFPANLIKEDISIILIQVLVRTLITQNADGSWGHPHSCEETAYAVITISQLDAILFDSPVRLEADSVLENGRQFLCEKLNTDCEVEQLWVEKVLYGSAILSQSYILAALNLAYKRTSSKLGELACSEEILKSYRFYKKLPMFSDTPEWRLNGALFESSLFSKRIKRDPALCIFPRQGMREEKYLGFIPFTWVGGAGRGLVRNVLSPGVCEAMMIMSALIYQTDEFMEHVVASLPGESFNEAKKMIQSMFLELHIAQNGNGARTPHASRKTHDGSSNLEYIKYTLTRFVNYTLHHPSILKASTYDQQQLKENLEEFLLAHLRQAKDNRQLSVIHKLPSSGISFFHWARSTGANHTGGPFAFSFLLCLVGVGHSAFSTALQNYVAEDVSRHLSTLCRLYNDFGSVTRDRSENNLNSLNFPEFSHLQGENTDATLKQRLMEVATYERACLDASLDKLREITSEEVWKVVEAFCDVTNLYGEMYILKDLTPSLKRMTDIHANGASKRVRSEE